jgi:hypothetical protein
MTDPELPAGLAALERRLVQRPPVDPPVDLETRVLSAVRSVIREPRREAAAGWRFWAALAASFLAVVNLSMSLATGTDWDFEPAPPAARIAPELRALAPDLPASEWRRQSLLARAGAGLIPTQNVSHHPEPLRWDAR